ncbi:hypothetical protein PT281_03855 [Lactobacillus sp. ESL0701]|uniref:hypothetical protein n=1 Tax=Lactobacillus sp. ESL0701 TaxID=2983217 RepID=UPI0023F90050|nr:hypothetical protein [Lactobacillus sp. ESL0701]MDF7672398.1 hypothetical protein [Lactobacillus sp. ESL0701]
MNEHEFLQLVSDRVFSFQSKLDNGNWSVVLMSEEAAYLTVIFSQDHRLLFPSKIGFYPEERYWEFDEREQLIVLTNWDQNWIVAKYLLPTKPNDHYFILENMTDSNKRYILYKDFTFTSSIEQKPVLASQRVIFMVNNSNKTAVENYALDNNCIVHWLDDLEDNSWTLIKQVWQEIYADERIKQVGIVLVGITKFGQELLTKKLTVNSQLISGTRQEVVIVLAQLLIKHYHQLLAKTPEQLPAQLLTDVAKIC